MATLAAIGDLATITGRPAADAHLVLALRRASDRFTGDCLHQNGAGAPCLILEEDDTVDLDGDGSDTLLLPAGPVVGTPTVMVDGSPVTAFQVNRRAAILRRTGGYWPRGLGNISVTYSHGFAADKVPGDIADAVLEHAATLATTMAHIQQEGGLSQSATNFAAAQVGVTQKWADTVARYQMNRGDRA